LPDGGRPLRTSRTTVRFRATYSRPSELPRPASGAIGPKEIVLLRGHDGRFHLRLERRDIDRARRELPGQ
jgi:hypothetical protein